MSKEYEIATPDPFAEFTLSEILRSLRSLRMTESERLRALANRNDKGGGLAMTNGGGKEAG